MTIKQHIKKEIIGLLSFVGGLWVLMCMIIISPVGMFYESIYMCFNYGRKTVKNFMQN